MQRNEGRILRPFLCYLLEMFVSSILLFFGLEFIKTKSKAVNCAIKKHFFLGIELHISLHH